MPPTGKRRGGLLSILCCTGGRADDHLPLLCFDQDEELIFYRVEFSLDGMNQNCWSMGVTEKSYLMVKTVVKPPDIWIGHIKLREILEDDEVTVDFENEFRKVTIILQKPDLYSWNSVGTYLPDHNTVVPSDSAMIDYYPGTILLREPLDHHHYLFAIYTGGEYYFGVPPGWNMRIKINDDERSYCTVRLLTLQQIERYRRIEHHKTIGQVTFFIIRIFETGKVTTKLAELPLNRHGVLQIGGIHGKFDVEWLRNTDRLVMLAGGSGVAPFTSILKFIHDHEHHVHVKQVILIYSFRASMFSKVPWHDAWETLATYDWFYYIPYITTGQESDGSRFTVESIKNDLEEIPLPKAVKQTENNAIKIRAITCGPHGFSDSTAQILKTLGVVEDDIYMFSK